MRWFHIAGIVVAAVVLLAVAATFAYFSVMGPWDEPPPDDSDLILERPQIPDDQNGYTYLMQAIQVLNWPGYTPPSDGAAETDGPAEPAPEAVEAEKEKGRRLQEMLDGGPWDADLAAETLAANEETFALIEKALACPSMQVPPVRCDTRVSYTYTSMKLASLLTLRSLAAVRAGDEGSAFENALAITKFGDRVQHAKGVVVVFLVGTTVKGMGTEVLEDLLPGTTLPAERLAPYARRLGEFADSSRGLADVFRAEYEMDTAAIEDLRSGRITMEGVGHPGDKAEPAQPIPTSYIFKPNQTRRLLATRHRSLIENASRPYAEVRLPAEPSWLEGDWVWLSRLGPNMVGRMLYCVLNPSGEVLTLECRARTYNGAVQTLIALRCYKMREGRLPETLDALVPEYLDAVPIDDFDGKPIRYSREKRILYSVGKDLEDCGGFTSDEAEAWAKENRLLDEGETLNPWDLPDPSFPIAF